MEEKDQLTAPLIRDFLNGIVVMWRATNAQRNALAAAKSRQN